MFFTDRGLWSVNLHVRSAAAEAVEPAFFVDAGGIAAVALGTQGCASLLVAHLIRNSLWDWCPADPPASTPRGIGGLACLGDRLEWPLQGHENRKGPGC